MRSLVLPVVRHSEPVTKLVHRMNDRFSECKASFLNTYNVGTTTNHRKLSKAVSYLQLMKYDFRLKNF